MAISSPIVSSPRTAYRAALVLNPDWRRFRLAVIGFVGVPERAKPGRLFGTCGPTHLKATDTHCALSFFSAS
jgi:hypothetical protein